MFKKHFTFIVIACIASFILNASLVCKIGTEEKEIKDFDKEAIQKIIPPGKSLHKKIGSRIFVAEEKYKNIKIPDSIYFVDDDGFLIKTIEIFPKNVLKRGIVRISGSPHGKYVGVYSSFAIPAKKDDVDSFNYKGKFAKGKEVFIAYDVKGNILWETKGLDSIDIFISDEGIVTFGYLHEGYLEFYTVNGESIDTIKLSDRGQEPGYDEEISVEPACAQDGNYVAITRTFSEETKDIEFHYTDYELFLIDIRKREVEFMDNFVGVKGTVQKISINDNVILVRETGKYLRAFDLNGKTLWKIDPSMPESKLGFRIDKIEGGKVFINLISWETKNNGSYRMLIQKKKELKAMTGEILSIEEVK